MGHGEAEEGRGWRREKGQPARETEDVRAHVCACLCVCLVLFGRLV